MSLAKRQKTCACCGQDIKEGDRINLEPLLDGVIRYVATLWDHSTFRNTRGGQRRESQSGVRSGIEQKFQVNPT